MKDKKASSVFATWFKRATIPSGLFDCLPEWKRSAIRHLCESAFDKGRRYERDNRKEEREQPKKNLDIRGVQKVCCMVDDHMFKSTPHKGTNVFFEAYKNAPDADQSNITVGHGLNVAEPYEEA